MSKRILAVAIAAAATFGIAMPARNAAGAECRRTCVMCDKTKPDCDGCIVFWVLYQPYEIC